MPDLDDLDLKKHPELIFRGLQTLVAVAPGDADKIEKLLDEDGSLKELPEDYKTPGFLTEDGTEVERDVDSDDTTSDGTLTTTRSDRTQDEKTLSFTMQETNMVALGLYWDQDLSDIKADENGEFSVESPEIAEQREYRVVSFGKDTTQGLIECKFFPRMVVSDLESVTTATRENTERGITMKALLDTDAGFDMKIFYVAPEKILESMGVDVSAMSDSGN